MRKILFRGKRVDNGEWVEGDLNQNHIHHKEHTIVVGGCVYHEVYKHTVGQYVGVEDSAGVKIFEGDVVLFQFYESELPVRGVVEYLIDESRFIIKDDMHYPLTCYDTDKLEVVGNIHDNKNLTK